MKEILRPFLKKLGFKKNGSFIEKSFEEFSVIFMIQKSQFSPGDFRILVGVDIHNYAEIFPERNAERYSFLCLRLSLNELVPNAEGAWYTSGKKLDDTGYFSELCSLIDNVTKMFFEGKTLIQVLENVYLEKCNPNAYEYLIVTQVKTDLEKAKRLYAEYQIKMEPRIRAIKERVKSEEGNGVLMELEELSSRMLKFIESNT